jgi:hypothetical protein
MLGYCFPNYGYINFEKKGLGYILDDFFQIPIWSPCPQLCFHSLLIRFATVKSLRAILMGGDKSAKKKWTALILRAADKSSQTFRTWKQLTQLKHYLSCLALRNFSTDFNSYLEMSPQTENFIVYREPKRYIRIRLWHYINR